MWVEDENGNLVAEKRDNAYTFAEYLNTSPIIAMIMLAEQGYNVEKGILKLKAGDVFQVEHFAASPESRESLGLVGNKIRDNAGSELGKNLFENYWNGGGDIELSGKQFAGMLMYIKNNDPQVVATSPATSTLGEMTVDGTANVVSFYGSNEYERAYGSASVYYNQNDRAVGFYDMYDFNKQPWGNRTVKNEIITRGVNFASPKKAQPFSIRYGFSSR